MIWMTNEKRPKDHCPYCREQMITPEEMQLAATKVLGKDRVKELMANHEGAGEKRDIAPASVQTDSTVESVNSTAVPHLQNQDDTSMMDRTNVEIHTANNQVEDDIGV